MTPSWAEFTLSQRLRLAGRLGWTAWPSLTEVTGVGRLWGIDRAAPAGNLQAREGRGGLSPLGI